MRNEYDVRRQFMLARLKAIPNVSVVEPQGAFYFFVNCSGLGLKSTNLCDKLLTRYCPFGASNFEHPEVLCALDRGIMAGIFDVIAPSQAATLEANLGPSHACVTSL